MSQLIFNNAECIYIFSDNAVINWPEITDGNISLIVGLPFTPTIKTGVSCPIGVTSQFITLQDGNVVFDTDGVSKQLEESKIEKFYSLSNYCHNIANSGVTIGGLAVGTNLEARTDLNGVYLLAQTNPEFTTKWVLSTNQSITLTAEQILQLAPAVGQFYSACYNTQDVHITNIQALTSKADVDAYDFTTGWPEGT